MIMRALEDSVSPRFLLMALGPFFVPIVILGGFFIYGGNELFMLLENGAKEGDFSFLDESAHPTLAYLLSFAVIHWIIVALFALIGTFGVVLFSVIIAVITVGFMTPFIVKNVRKRHYKHVPAGKEESFLLTMWKMLKIVLLFLLLLLVALPMLLVPLLNVIALQIPFFYLFYKLMMVDIISTGVTQNAKMLAKQYKVELLLILLGFYFLALIPFLGLLLQVFFVTYLSHFFLSRA